MKNVVQYTVKQVCEILEVDMPAQLAAMADTTLPIITRVRNSLVTGGAFILVGKDNEERTATLEKAMKKKPTLIIAGRASRSMLEKKGIPHIIVKDAYDAMIRLSGQIRDDLGLKVVGVTGSLGKTTTKEMIHSVLKQYYNTDKNYGNRNNGNGIFLSMQNVEKDVQFYVQEFGVAIGKKSMESKISACRPNAAVITNISDPHLDVFGTRENILKEKIKLVTEMEKGSPAFLSYDDELLKTVKLDDHPIISYAIENKEADYHADNIEYIEDYIKFDAVHGDTVTPVVLHSRETHNIRNALAAMAVAEWFGVPTDKIVEGIDAFRAEGIRQSLTNVGGYNLYVDCYNTAPVSLLGTVEVLERMEVAEGGKRVAVIGDIVRLGTEEEEIHRNVGKKIGQSKIDLALCFGNNNARIMAESIRAEDTAALYTDDRDVLNEWMRNLITKKDVTLIKGPVARLLSKTIDQVYGTSYHLSSEHHELIRQDDYQMDILFEKEDYTKRMTALKAYRGNDSVHTVPAECNGTDVFCVGPKCFRNNEALAEIVIPAPIFNISERAFSGCKKLRRVSLPETLMVIDEKAFRGCKALEEIIIPKGTIHIGKEAFKGCTNLKRVVIPATVGYIGEKAFEECADVTVECAENTVAYDFAEANGLKIK